jgi:hypothetical protein
MSIIDKVIKKEAVWVNGKCLSHPNNYSADFEKGIVIDGSFTNWKDVNGNIYLSSWFVKNNGVNND